jgi:hypothetical protein
MTKVIYSPCVASRAHVVCHTEHTHTGIINNTSLSDHAHVRARAIPGIGRGTHPTERAFYSASAFSTL